MSVIYVMIPMALVLVAFAVWALVWAIRSGQFDELESHGWTPVLDDDERPAPDGERTGESSDANQDSSASGSDRERIAERHNKVDDKE